MEAKECKKCGKTMLISLWNKHYWQCGIKRSGRPKGVKATRDAVKRVVGTMNRKFKSKEPLMRRPFIPWVTMALVYVVSWVSGTHLQQVKCADSEAKDIICGKAVDTRAENQYRTKDEAKGAYDFAMKQGYKGVKMDERPNP